METHLDVFEASLEEFYWDQQKLLKVEGLQEGVESEINKVDF